MMMKAGFALVALGAALCASPVLAASATVQQLLDDGFAVVGTDVVPAEVVQRAMGAEWKDDYFLTLQNGNRIAFCHATLASTTDAASFTGVNCTVSEGGAARSAPPQPRLPRPPQ